MNLVSFLSNVAANYTQRYTEYVANLDRHYSKISTPSLSNETNLPASTPTEAVEDTPVDAYQPGTDASSGIYEKPTVDNPDDSDVVTALPGADDDGADNDKTLTTVKDLYYSRQARLNYELNLKFDLAAFAAALSQVADGEAISVQEFAEAGFGLHTDLQLSGFERIVTNKTDADMPRTHAAERTRARQKQVGKLRVQSRDFQLNSFYREATKIRRSLHVDNQENHRRATNRFALRFSLDNRFSMQMANRFNVQTRQVADQLPEEVGKYVDTTGGVAAGGTAEMMVTFFDAVDSYLAQTETATKAKIDEFFALAAESLGLEGAMVEATRESLAATIDTFFDRAAEAVSMLAGQYQPLEALPGQQSGAAQEVFVPDGNDSTAQTRGQLAVA